ncbi:hypothetical protein Cst_c00360 [Thermoclostridium stercorarium subsp. stercorarium DSM 8532]|uniref:Uncharacterized protein n=1 Tax=Thermoclostridium stercorarium (strain ATCC 35414 / DSM 8532 / NCIMB 11754) TaxID=1121335 RepID=L7VNF3_THES1|nr:hypothetical protein Cst_c00360 [Thermoclostridium stercorarium subsp. stercorarium DSM 8532]
MCFLLLIAYLVSNDFRIFFRKHSINGGNAVTGENVVYQPIY